MTEKNTTTAEFPLNQALLKAAKEIKQEWEQINKRLEKIKQSKAELSEVVYERVCKDYTEKNSQIHEKLLLKKAEIDRELETLSLTEQKISTQLEQHHHDLEEVKFRNNLGEFTEAEYKEKVKTAESKAKKFEAMQSAVESNIKKYTAVFADAAEIFSEQELAITEDADSEAEQTAAPKSAEKLTSSKPSDTEPLTDDSGYIIEEEGPDYFSDTAGGSTETNTEVESDKEVEPKKPVAKKGAKLVFINGKDAGTAFHLSKITSLGRAQSNTISLNDPKASRQHSKVEKKGKNYVVLDLNSSNGTLVNGEKVKEHVLANGDELQVGDAILQFQE